MLPRRVEEVEPVARLLDRQRVSIRAVLEDELLEVVERPLVVDLLPDLHQRPPRVLRRQPRAVGTLPVLDHELDLEDLLQDRRGQHLQRSVGTSNARRTSFWTVSLTRRRFECGSVQMKPASINRTSLRPLSRRRQIASSSRDSSSAGSQFCGGDR